MEIKKELIKLEEGESYIPGPDSYVITEDHTLADILRFCVEQVDKEDCLYILNNMDLD